MWWILAIIALVAIGIMLAGVALWLIWQIVRFILNLICSIFFGQGEAF